MVTRPLEPPFWIHEAQCAGVFFDIYRADYSVGMMFPASNQTLKLGWFRRAGCAGAAPVRLAEASLRGVRDPVRQGKTGQAKTHHI